MMNHTIIDEDVANTFNMLDVAMYEKLMELRALIYSEADKKEVELTESLKWGQPSYKAKNGTSIRIGVFNEDKSKAALYVNCSTTIIPEYRQILDNILIFSGNRAIILDVHEPLPENELSIIIVAALTYHQR